MRRWAGWLWALAVVWSLGAVVLAQEDGPGVHVVQRGETLQTIAARYGLDATLLAQTNGMVSPFSLQVGQRLLIPRGQPMRAVGQHVVRPGESLSTVAALYNLPVETLATANRFGQLDLLYVGQVLSIPQPRPEQADAAPLAVSLVPTFHNVRPGDTLYRIARQYGLTVAALVSANGLVSADTIYVGQVLVLPESPDAPAPVVLPAPLTTVSLLPPVLYEGTTGGLMVLAARPVTVVGTFLDRSFVGGTSEARTEALVLLGVPVGTEDGVYPLELAVTDAQGTRTTLSISVRVLAGGYGREVIALIADRGNLLDPTVEQAELDILTRVMSAITPDKAFNGPMSLPAAAPMTSPFGTRRSYNGGSFDRFHTGADFAGAPGTPVLAAAAGRVVLADSLNVRGLATVIDHGWGVYTGYWHQAQQYVRVGEAVQKGQVIGTIGASGRVTGAHLHWELWVQGVPVDPMQWVQVAFDAPLAVAQR